MDKNNIVVNQFIIDVVLIEPITEIINNLTIGKYRDCDIKWLQTKLNAFIKFAAETLGITGLIDGDGFKEDFPHMNDYVKRYYKEKFTILLDYFRSM